MSSETSNVNEEGFAALSESELEIDLKKVDLELEIEWLEDSIDFKKEASEVELDGRRSRFD